MPRIKLIAIRGTYVDSIEGDVDRLANDLTEWETVTDAELRMLQREQTYNTLGLGQFVIAVEMTPAVKPTLAALLNKAKQAEAKREEEQRKREARAKLAAERKKELADKRKRKLFERLQKELGK